MQSGLLHLVQDCAGELVRRGAAAHIVGSCLAILNDLVNGLGDAVRVVIETQVSEQHRRGEDQRSRVSLVLALDIETNVTASRLEHGHVTTHVASRHNTRSTDKPSADVGKDTTVQVRHDHDIELLWSRDALHRGVVDNHVVGLEGRIVLSDLLEGVAEETVGKLHDVGLVDAGNLLAVVGKGKSKGEFGNAL